MSQTTSPEQTEAQELDDRLRDTADPAMLIVIGRRCQQLAFESTYVLESEAYADRASLAFSKARERKDSRIYEAIGMLAGFALDQEPLTRPLIVEHRMPDLATVAEVNSKMIQSLSRLKYTPETSHPYDVFAANCLMNYWQVNDYEGEDELVLPSFLSKPIAVIEKHPELYTEDGSLSVFYRDEKGVRVLQRFQVANGDPKFDTGLSSPNLPAIRISQDLCIHFDDYLDQKGAKPDEEDKVLKEEPRVRATAIVAEMRRSQDGHNHTRLRRRAYQFRELLALREGRLQTLPEGAESEM